MRKSLFRTLSAIAAGLGTLLLVETGRVADALGASAALESGGTHSGAFWYQLSFMRLFGVALIGLGALSAWAGSHLSDTQQRSLATVLAITFAGLALMASFQQVAIWNAPAGWAVAGVLGAEAVLYLSVFRGTAGRGYPPKPGNAFDAEAVRASS